MRILYVHLYAVDFSPGGADCGVFDLARSMKEDYHEEVHCVTNEGLLAERLRSRGIGVSVLPSKKTQVLAALHVLRRTLAAFQPNVIHSHHRYTTFLLDLFFKDKAFLLHTQRVTHQDKRSFFRCGHLATAVSEGVRLNLIQDFHVPPELVLTIPNAVWMRPLDPARLAEVRGKYPKKSGELLVLCNARLTEQKGHVYLIEAVQKLPQASRDRLRILLAGDGPLRSFLEQQIKHRGVESSFTFLGYTENIPELLTHTDFSVLPSLWEGLPRTLIESFLMGRTVLVTDIPGVREVLRPGENGLKVPPRDSGALAGALQQLMDKPMEIERMQAIALNDSEKFSFKKMTTAYHELYLARGKVR